MPNGTASASALNDGLSLQVSPPLWSGGACCLVRGYHPGRGERRFSIYVWIYLDMGPTIGIFIFTYSLSFPPASLSLHALFQTLRRLRFRLLRQRLFSFTPSRVVVASGIVFQHAIAAKKGTSDLVGGDVAEETTRRARTLRTRRRAVSSRSVRRGSMGKRRVTHSSIRTKLTVFNQERTDYAGVFQLW